MVCVIQVCWQLAQQTRWRCTKFPHRSVPAETQCSLAICRAGPTAWLPCSQNLTPLDISLSRQMNEVTNFLTYPTNDRGGDWQRSSEYETNRDHRWDIHRSTGGIHTEYLCVTFEPFLMSRHSFMSLRLVFAINFFPFVEKFFVHQVHFTWLPSWFCNFRKGIISTTDWLGHNFRWQLPFTTALPKVTLTATK